MLLIKDIPNYTIERIYIKKKKKEKEPDTSRIIKTNNSIPTVQITINNKKKIQGIAMEILLVKE